MMQPKPIDGRIGKRFELTDHVPDNFPGVIKTRIVVDPSSGILTKKYISEKRFAWVDELLFNERVEKTGYPQKPRIFGSKDLETSVEYFPGSKNFEMAVIEGHDIDYVGLLQLLVEEAEYLQRADIAGLVDWSDPYLGARRLISEDHGLLSANEREDLNSLVQESEERGGLLRFDPEASNILVLPNGEFVNIDYSLPFFGHPLHNLSYFVLHLDIPRRKDFLAKRREVLRGLSEAVNGYGQKFMQDPSKFDATFKASMIHSFAINWLTPDSKAHSPFVRREDIEGSNAGHSYDQRREVLRRMISSSSPELLRDGVGYMRD